MKANVGFHRTSTPTLAIRLAQTRDRPRLYQLRHQVYAHELGQHPVREAGQLHDALDEWNQYLVAEVEGEIVGMISLTPPTAPAFSLDKYFDRTLLPFPWDNRIFEIRLLTVAPEFRGRELALLLMYAAFRHVQAHGGTRIVAIGRQEVLPMYERVGLRPTGHWTRSGLVTYGLMHGSVESFQELLPRLQPLLERLEEKTQWKLAFPFHRAAPCFHGGSFFKAVGEDFQNLERAEAVINADVLDAWFPPAPGVMDTLQQHLPWLLRTSPPTDCAGLIKAISTARGVLPENLLPGAGSSDLIFRAFPHWLNRRSHVLILDPTYGEYAHVLEKVVGCTVDRLTLARKDGYQVNVEALKAALSDDYDLVVLVNPNSPTGRHLPRALLEKILHSAPVSTRIWIDETYIDYVDSRESLETVAARSENLIICKSMSKAYALSGARVAYLCAGRHQLESLRAITPPWVVSLTAQVAATRALQDPGYYQDRFNETRILRADLAADLATLGWEIIPGVANFILSHLPDGGPTAAQVIGECRKEDLFLRDPSSMSSRMGDHAIRLAVKDGATNRRLFAILASVWSRLTGAIRLEAIHPPAQNHPLARETGRRLVGQRT